MKLRLKNNSVRLRLTQGETAQFAAIGRVEEKIEFGIGEAHKFSYALEIVTETETINANFENNRITIFIPEIQAQAWANTTQVGIEAEQNIGDGKTLRILIEKDFACLQPRAGEDETDAFPNPSDKNIC